MITAEKIRWIIVRTLLYEPELGKNYIDWHTENLNECGVTISYPNKKFEIIIKQVEE